jgi:hypothetical protein
MILHKINRQVGDHNDWKLKSYKQVLPCTLSIPLQGTWIQFVQEYNAAHPGQVEKINTFHATLKAILVVIAHMMIVTTLSNNSICNQTEQDENSYLHLLGGLGPNQIDL